jgi:hypothetical protein
MTPNPSDDATGSNLIGGQLQEPLFILNRVEQALFERRHRLVAIGLLTGLIVLDEVAYVLAGCPILARLYPRIDVRFKPFRERDV